MKWELLEVVDLTLVLGKWVARVKSSSGLQVSFGDDKYEALWNMAVYLGECGL